MPVVILVSGVWDSSRHCALKRSHQTRIQGVGCKFRNSARKSDAPQVRQLKSVRSLVPLSLLATS